MEMHGMDAGIARDRLPETPSAGATLEARLERGQLLSLDACPFRLPEPADQEFLRQQRLFRGKEIAYDPARQRLWGHAPSTDEARLERILAEGLTTATAWISGLLPRYRGGLAPFRACFHPEEEATRTLRMAARNDLLHVDAARPVVGARVLRLG